MDKIELEKIKNQLGLKWYELAQLCGVTPEGVRKWRDADHVSNAAVVRLLRVLSAHPELLQEACAAADNK